MTNPWPRRRTRLLLALALVPVLLGALLVLREGVAPRSAGAASSTAGPALLSQAPAGEAPARSAGPSAGVAPAQGTVVLSSSWGAAEGQLGRRQEAEANPEGPMALVAVGKGELWVLDQVNRRVQRFQDGRAQASIALGGDTARDLARTPSGGAAVLDPHVDRDVKVYDPEGRLQNQVPLGGKDAEEPGLLTGVFADREGIYVEREHERLVRVATAVGAADPERGEIAGRPSRDGRLLLRAAISDRAAGQVRVDVLDRSTGQLRFSQILQLPAPILNLLLLDSDRLGQIYLAAATARESMSPPYEIMDERITVLRLGSGGALRGVLNLPPLLDAAECERPLSVDDDGAVYLMRPRAGGLEVVRYLFP